MVCMQITTKVSDHQDDIGVKGQGCIYLNSILRFVTQTPISCFVRGHSNLAQ